MQLLGHGQLLLGEAAVNHFVASHERWANEKMAATVDSESCPSTGEREERRENLKERELEGKCLGGLGKRKTTRRGEWRRGFVDLVLTRKRNQGNATETRQAKQRETTQINMEVTPSGWQVCLDYFPGGKERGGLLHGLERGWTREGRRKRQTRELVSCSVSSVYRQPFARCYCSDISGSNDFAGHVEGRRRIKWDTVQHKGPGECCPAVSCSHN